MKSPESERVFASMKNNVVYCLEKVKDYDFDYYLILKMLPQKDQQILLPLWALHAELSKICQIVTEETIGLIRLQWWRDEIAALYMQDENQEMQNKNHPVLSLLFMQKERFSQDIMREYISCFEPLLAGQKGPQFFQDIHQKLYELMIKVLSEKICGRIGDGHAMTRHLTFKYLNGRAQGFGKSLFDKLAKYYQKYPTAKDKNYLGWKKFIQIVFLA